MSINTKKLFWCNVDSLGAKYTQITVYEYWLRNKKRKRRYWIHPLIRHRQHSNYLAAKELNADEEKFQSFYRMSQPAFHRSLQLVGPSITKKDID